MKKSTDKVSIIMPVYNTPEDYMQVSVNSILEQTYDNIELIIVDDGSEKSCADYCDSLALKDDRIKIIHKCNSGVSSARNTGTESATGSYVMYVDSDDILDSRTIQKGMKAVCETGAPFVFAGIQHISDYSCFSNDKDENKAEPDYTVYHGKEIDKLRSAFLALRDRDFLNIEEKGFVNRGPYARLIRKDIAVKVKFNERLRIGEDVEWNMRLLNESDSVCFVKSIWYGYLIHQTSSLRKYYGNRASLLEDYHRTLYESNKDFCDSHMNDYVYNVVISFYTMVLYEYLSEQNPKSEREKTKEIKQLLKKSPWNLMLNKKTINSIPIQFILFLVSCKSGCCLPMLRFWKKIKKKVNP